MNKKYWIIAAVAVAIFVAAIVVLWRASGLVLIAKASYSCDGGKTISAAFYKNKQTPPAPAPGEPPKPNGVAALALSDGRKPALGQTVSADGSRYANADESMVFWSKGYGAFVMEQGTTTYSNCIQIFPVNSFTNTDGGYAFEFPSIWNAAVNQYNKDNSLFGPDVTGTSGLGGVEVFKNQKSIDSFLGGVSAKYSGKADITIDGVSGVVVSYQAYPQSGEEVVLFRNGTIYNIYINSVQSDDLAYFERLVSSFKFIK